MNLEEIQTYVSLFKEFLTGIAALTAAIVAVLGLRTWKEQLKGKTEYELAQKLLKGIYKTRDAIYHVRNPVISSGEISQAVKENSIVGEFKNPKFQAEYQTAVYQKRWQYVSEAMNDLELYILEAEAMWDEKNSVLYKELKSLIGELFGNLQTYINYINSPEKYQNSSPSLIEKVQDIIYGFNDTGKDKFTMHLLELVRKFEKNLKPKLRL